jgi:hypothetical protein
LRHNVELVEASGGDATAKMTLHPHHLTGLGTVSVAMAADITFRAAVSTGVLYATAKEIAKHYKLGSYSISC